MRVELQCRPMRDAIFTIVHGWWLFVERREKSVCAPFFIQQQELLQPSTVNQPSIKTKCSPCKLKRGEFCSRGCWVVGS